MSKIPQTRQGHRPVAIVGFSQSKSLRADRASNEVEMLLPIVHDVVLAHGGTVEAHSEEGQGARFVVVLPTGLPESGNPGARPMSGAA